MRTQIASVILLAMLTPSAASPDALADRVAALTKPFKGTVVFYAKNLKTGKDFGVGADTKVKTASTIKLPILCTLESLVAQGRVRWDEHIVLKPEDKVTGSGVLGSLADGTELTVRAVDPAVRTDGRDRAWREQLGRPGGAVQRDRAGDGHLHRARQHGRRGERRHRDVSAHGAAHGGDADRVAR